MTELMERYNYRGWYVGIMDADGFQGSEEEHGPFSKRTAITHAKIFNSLISKIAAIGNKCAVAISGREVIMELVKRAERKTGWDPNP